MNETKATFRFPGGTTVEIVQGDITTEKVDAIINAANAHLQHGGGVAAAIARAGGPQIQQESNAWVREHGPVEHDRPAYTSGGKLPCRYVIHAVGPVWGEGDEDAKLDQAIAGSLKLAEDLGLQTLAFPAISTGIYGFPKERAAEIFFTTLKGFFEVRTAGSLRQIRLVLYDTPTLRAFEGAFERRSHELGEPSRGNPAD